MAMGLSITPSLSASTQDLLQMENQIFGPTVRLGEYCSGSIISSERDEVTGKVDTYVLTAKHCTKKIGEESSIQKEFHDKRNHLTKTEVYNTTTWGQYFGADLAIVKLSDTDTFFPNVAKIAPKGYEESVQFGQDVWVVGHPFGKSMTLTEGVLGFVESDPGFGIGSKFYRATPDIAPGSSGGALYTKDGDGDFVLIGIVTGGAGGFTFFNYFTTLEDINNYLETARKAF